MAHTNQTPNYGLSEFIGSDKPAWLIDYNGDMEKIDLGMKAAKDVADAAKEEADQGAIDIAAVTITANSADAKSTAAVSNFAEAYDATATYNVGEYVTYENLMYKCITAITVPESFDGSHWSRVTVDNELRAIEGAIDTLITSASYSHEYMVNANSQTEEVFRFTPPEGYKAFSVLRVHTGHSQIVLSDFSLSDGQVSFIARSIASSPITATATVKVGFIKNI
jgi:hypothetical protein